MSATPLEQTALYPLHLELGARMVAFAGYEMPVHYRLGILKEHQHTRHSAGMFDVSHMAQIKLVGANAAAALESLAPANIIELKANQQRYALLTNDAGGIIDDLMVTRIHHGDENYLFVVLNAANKQAKIAYLQEKIADRCKVIELHDYALLALQGPMAALVMQRLSPSTDFVSWTFMQARILHLEHMDCVVTRSGYTGEDGFEISIPNDQAEFFGRLLLSAAEVRAIGLGARDSLRLEAGLCLYGQDIDHTTTPVEANLHWAIAPARRADGKRPGGFPGAEKIFEQLESLPESKRVGLIGLERTPVRGGALIVNADDEQVGRVTSGGFAPSYGAPIAMGYVASDYAVIGSEVFALVRDKPVAMRVAKYPFVPQRYYRG